MSNQRIVRVSIDVFMSATWETAHAFVSVTFCDMPRRPCLASICLIKSYVFLNVPRIDR